jgi:hypothetical protein
LTFWATRPGYADEIEWTPEDLIALDHPEDGISFAMKRANEVQVEAMPSNEIKAYQPYEIIVKVKAPLLPAQFPFHRWNIRYTTLLALNDGENPSDEAVVKDFDLASPMEFTVI